MNKITQKKALENFIFHISFLRNGTLKEISATSPSNHYVDMTQSRTKETLSKDNCIIQILCSDISTKTLQKVMNREMTS